MQSEPGKWERCYQGGGSDDTRGARQLPSPWMIDAKEKRILLLQSVWMLPPLADVANFCFPDSDILPFLFF